MYSYCCVGGTWRIPTTRTRRTAGSDHVGGAVQGVHAALAQAAQQVQAHRARGRQGEYSDIYRCLHLLLLRCTTTSAAN